jgi:hydrogenase maturation protease
MVDDQRIETWDEGIERSMELSVALSHASVQRQQIRFPATQEKETLQDTSGQTVGFVTRTQHELSGIVTVASAKIDEDLFKLKIEVTNSTAAPVEIDRNAALLGSLVSAHLILTGAGGEFVSLLDPPAELRERTAECCNIGNFPVLIGSEYERDMLLCSPIVLYDYPQVAPESAGDFYDATEMDEMLTLRVMTLTDQEKNEIHAADDRARDLLRRTEESAREQLMRTHGTIRSMRPAGEDR